MWWDCNSRLYSLEQASGAEGAMSEVRTGCNRSEGTKCEPTASGAPGGRLRARRMRAMDGYCLQQGAGGIFACGRAMARVTDERYKTKSSARNVAIPRAKEVAL